jgi:hypothetical protein
MTESYVIECEWSQTPPSVAIVEAIASLENSPPTDLPTTHGIVLSDVLDPEALDTLVITCEPLSLSFSVDKYDVQITGNTLIIRDS